MISLDKAIDHEPSQDCEMSGSDERVDQSGVGQDPPPPSKRQRLCQYWTFRFTSYKVDQNDLQSLLDEVAVAYGFQEEQGKGQHRVKHYQGTFDVGPSRMRWSQIEKKFQAIAKSPLQFPVLDYLEKSNSPAANRYAMKEDTRIAGPWYKGIDFEQIAIETVEPEYRIDIVLREWQEVIKRLILDKPTNARDIWWYWEPYGGLGKTTFQKWIFQNYPETMVLGGKAADMKNGVIEYLDKQKVENPKYPKIVILNLPMTFDINYFCPHGVEEVKDMFFFSGKYKGGMVCGNNPKVIIFANCRPPKEEDMAKDRWRIRRLPDGPGKDAVLDEKGWDEDLGPLDEYFS